MVKRKKGSQSQPQQQPEKDDQGNVVTPGTSKEADRGAKKSRIHISAVHEEYEQTKYVKDDEERTRSKCKHCVKVFDHKLCC